MDNFSQFHPQILSFSRSFWENSPMTDTADFSRSRLDQMIDLRHPLVVLASCMPRQELEASIRAFVRKGGPRGSQQ
jgi:hypothetical protein